MFVSSQNCIRDASLRIVPFFSFYAREGTPGCCRPGWLEPFLRGPFCFYFLNRYVIPYAGIMTLVPLGLNNA